MSTTAGTGFKAPDFKNRYQVFVNPASNYMVIGTEVHISLRANYRGKYPFGDANNNNFIDRYDQFVDGFLLLNATVEKRLFRDKLRVRGSIDNITGPHRQAHARPAG